MYCTIYGEIGSTATVHWHAESSPRKCFIDRRSDFKLSTKFVWGISPIREHESCHRNAQTSLCLLWWIMTIQFFFYREIARSAAYWIKEKNITCWACCGRGHCQKLLATHHWFTSQEHEFELQALIQEELEHKSVRCRARLRCRKYGINLWQIWINLEFGSNMLYPYIQRSCNKSNSNQSKLKHEMFFWIKEKDRERGDQWGMRKKCLNQVP